MKQLEFEQLKMRLHKLYDIEIDMMEPSDRCVNTNLISNDLPVVIHMEIT